MCPERQIISLYRDGELPSPWKEKMETHLSGCPECRAVLSGYRNLGECLQAVPDETIMAAQDRVWEKLTAPALVVSERPGEKIAPRRAERRAWNRSITLPLPVAAAAALVIIIAFFALMGIRGGSQSLPQNSMAVMDFGLDDYGTVPIQDMNGVLKYLSSQENGGDFMVIRLPESSKFSRTGEPALINAADYSRTRRNFPR